MPQRYKVFIYNKPVFFLKDLSDADYSEKDTLVLKVSDRLEFELLFSALAEPNSFKRVFVFGRNGFDVWKEFGNYTRTIEAAGGVIKNPKGEMLFMYRNGKLDLPKGKIDPDESSESAALREVEEECGISGMQIIKSLPPTFHTYLIENEWILKITHWYLLEYSGPEKFSPQKEEGITEVLFLSAAEFESRKEEAFGSVRQLAIENF